jgi:ribonuclease-3
MSDESVAAALGHRFADLGLLRRALTHRSHEPEVAGGPSNERLEFLGDAVLGMVIAEELYVGWSLSEGEMAKVRAAVVNETSLAGVARRIGIGSGLRLGRGEESTGGREKASILADAMEAVIGAVYLDGGLDAARRVILADWRPLISERAADPGRRDYKTRLQEALARHGLTPIYSVEGSGPDHRRSFTAEVEVQGRRLGRGTGTSKKRAQQQAARRALEELERPSTRDA